MDSCSLQKKSRPFLYDINDCFISYCSRMSMSERVWQAIRSQERSDGRVWKCTEHKELEQIIRTDLKTALNLLESLESEYIQDEYLRALQIALDSFNKKLTKFKKD